MRRISNCPGTAADRPEPGSDVEVELHDASRRAPRAATARHEAGRDFAAERGAWLQQKVTLQARRSALEGELAKTRSQLAAAIDLRARKDSQIAQLRAELDDSARQIERVHQDLLRAEVQAMEFTQSIALLCDEISALRSANRTLAAERDACLARLPGARLRALWQRLARICTRPFRTASRAARRPAKPE